MADKRKILITGANGFVGGALLSELQNSGQFEVFGIVGRKNPAFKLSPAQKIFQADISEYETFRETENLKNIDILIHCAGLAHQFGRIEREDFRKVNVRGTENVCRLAQKIGVRHFVSISSVAVYGDYGNQLIDETFECRPLGFYAESKLESERLAIEFCEKNNLRLTILRPSTVIGEGDRGNTARLITTIDKNLFFWIGKGINQKSLIYKTDLAKAILKMLESPEESGTEIYNLTAEAVSMSEIVGTISETLQRRPRRLKIPENLLRAFFLVNKTKLSFERLKKLEKTFEKWLSDDIFDGRKFREKFEFCPETKISEALERQVKYYLRQKKILKERG